MQIDKNTRRLFMKYGYTLSTTERKIMDKLIYSTSSKNINKLARKLGRDAEYIEKKAEIAIQKLKYVDKVMQECKAV